MNISINGQTELYGLIGQNINYTLSPVMHNTAFSFQNQNAIYLPLQTTEPNFLSFWNGLLSIENFKGANITIPFKTKAYQLVDQLTPESKQIGAVNTIRIENGKTIGTNTDIKGFVEPLLSKISECNCDAAIIVGAGGAARAVLVALANLGFKKIIILNRTLKTANILVEEFRQKFSQLILEAKRYTPEILVQLSQFVNLLVNCTPIGTKNQTVKIKNCENSIWPNTHNLPSNIIVYDLVYNPQNTLFSKQAKKTGATFIGGLEMLIHQGAGSYEFWTGESAPINQMRIACQSVLNQQNQPNFFNKE